MNKQNIFKFKFKNNDSYSNFYVNNTNKEAYNGIIGNNFKKTFLCGPKKSGKSFLCKIWSQKYNALEYKNNFRQLIKLQNNIFIDNLNHHINEEEIFHIINHTSLNNLNILITSDTKIIDMKLSLNDLNSRLKAFDFFNINQPDDDMLLNILTKLFIEKQFIINSNDIFQYIIKNTDRSYENIYNVVSKLDSLSLQKKRQLTIPLIKEIL